MREIRLYYDGEININDEIELAKDSHFHLRNVLKLRVNDKVTLINGDGKKYFAVLKNIDKQSSQVYIDQCSENHYKPLSKLVLVIALLKGNPMDYAIQKAVELGVTDILPMQTSRSERKYIADKWEKKKLHWQGIIRASALQCGRSEFPVLEECKVFDAAIGEYPHLNKWILSPAHDSDQSFDKGQGIAVMVGPEGGFTSTEVSQAMALNWHPYNMGGLVLRADTATVAGLTCAKIQLDQF